ncbi:MAG: prolyl oligopeptidase family serine peptidase [Variovorax sp.]
MTVRITAPFGSWVSPITSELVATAQTTLLDVLLDGGDPLWIEGRPTEGGRQVLMRLGSDGAGRDVTPQPFSARTRVHEYGGAAVAVSGRSVCFSNFADQRLYLQVGSEPPVALTPVADSAELRYADGLIDAQRSVWIGIREDHRNLGSEAINTIVSLPLASVGEGSVVVEGHDFYASPRISPDGTRLAWLAWNHPAMPWTSSELWVAGFDGQAVSDPICVAGGPHESVFQPEWSPDGLLHYVSDRSGWWNIYRRNTDGNCVCLCPMTAEFGRAQWTFGLSTYAFLSAREIVCTYIENGVGKLARLRTKDGQLTPLQLPWTEFSALRASGNTVVFKAGGPAAAGAVVLLDMASGRVTIIKDASGVAGDASLRDHISEPRFIEFPTSGGKTAFALYYPPTSAGYQAPAGTLPPLLVKCHGGPTSCASRSLDLRTQFWTSRGVAVVDVDYGGSSGYGRAYRDRLHSKWGLVDAEDCAAVASHLATCHTVDGARMVISGGSAGGFTALTCLTHPDPALRSLFKAGASHYGVSDLENLARDTHKFESRYLDWLIGPLVELQTYIDRSPLRHADRLAAPVAFFQGAEDKVVPPNQTEQMVAALRAQGLTTLYLLFAGEQHGFRQSSNIKWALDAEFYFYGELVW